MDKATQLRKPNPAYIGKNGFREADGAVDQDHITLRNARFAQYILATKGVFVPSRETLCKLGENKQPPVETVVSIDKKIKQLKEQHAKDIHNLFRFQLAEYHQELIDHSTCYALTDTDIDESYPDKVEFKKGLENLDKEMARMDRFQRDAEDALSTLRYTHLKLYLQLIKKRNMLKAQDTTARQRRDPWFPQTSQQFKQITDREVQLRVARFLTSTTVEQEKMMDEFGWPYRAVHPLLSFYKANPTFKSEVGNALSGLYVPDPRRRGSKALSMADDGPVFTQFEPIS